MNIKISIIVPIYNVEKYVVRCIESIIAQTYSNLEIICIDDGSTDQSGYIVDHFSEEDARIIAIHKRNEGLVAARKDGCMAATGEYIINVDGDDWIEKDYISNFVKYIKNGEYDCVWTVGYAIEYKHKSVPRIAKSMKQEDYLAISLSELIPSMWVKLVKRDIYCMVQNSVDNRITQQEDITFTIRLLAHKPTIYFCENIGYHYVKRDDSMSHTVLGNNNDEIILFDTINYLEKIHAEIDYFNKTYLNYVRLKMLHEFEMLQRECDMVLFPFDNICRGDRVVIFGAGPVGKNIVKHILKTGCIEIVRWVDSNLHGETVEGITIDQIENINSANYDKVIIAVTKFNDISDIKRRLLEMGINDSHISSMDIDEMIRYGKKVWTETMDIRSM